MAIFEIQIDRPVTSYERFTRYVEAPSMEAALEIGARLAREANRACPDDTHDTGCDPDNGDWAVYDEGCGPVAEPPQASRAWRTYSEILSRAVQGEGA